MYIYMYHPLYLHVRIYSLRSMHTIIVIVECTCTYTSYIYHNYIWDVHVYECMY